MAVQFSPYCVITKECSVSGGVRCRRFVELVTMDILSGVIPGSIYLFGKSFFVIE